MQCILLFIDSMLMMNPLDMFPLEDRVAYIYSPWEYKKDMQCLNVTYYTVGPSLNTLSVFLQYDDGYLNVSYVESHTVSLRIFARVSIKYVTLLKC